MTDDTGDSDDSAAEATEDTGPTEDDTGASETAPTPTDEGALAAVGTRLDALREDATRRRLATLGAVVVGLGVAWVHWLGFVLGGALVALAQSSLRRGLLAGLGFGLVCWLAFAVWIAQAGNLALFLGMGQVFTVTSVIPFAGGLLGSLARGIR